MENAVRTLLSGIGENPDRPGLSDTPARVTESLGFLTQGYAQDPEAIIAHSIFTEPDDEMILVKDISFYSLCEHHLLPFFGRAHVAYIPKGRIVGLSDIARLVDAVSRRLQVQERLTQQIATILQKTLKPHGTAVIIEADHLCLQMRGVQKHGAKMVTSAMLGSFRTDHATRHEFLSMINNQNNR